MLRNQSLLRLSSLLFMAQAFIWWIFSLLCILCIENVIKNLTHVGNYAQALNNFTYFVFFDADDNFETDLIVQPKVFEGFAFVHFFIAISWFILSGIILIKSSSNRIQSLLNSILLKCWLVNGYVVAFVDCIFSILLMIDMINATWVMDIMQGAMCMQAIGLVFTIASRGCTLLVVNVVLIIKLTRSMWCNPRAIKYDEYNTTYGTQYGGTVPVNSGYVPAMQPQQSYPIAVQQQQNGNTRMGTAVQQGYEQPNRQMDAVRQPPPTPSGYPTTAHVSPYAQINRNQIPGRQSPPILHADDICVKKNEVSWTSGTTGSSPYWILLHLDSVPSLTPLNIFFSAEICETPCILILRVQSPQIPDPDYQVGPRTVLKNRSQYDARY